MRNGTIVKRVLLNGMSGTGKSIVTAARAARGYAALDLDQVVAAVLRLVQ